MQGLIFSLIFIDKLSVRGSVTHLKLNNYWAVDLRLTPRSGQVHGHSISLDTYPASAMLSFILRNLYTIEKFLSLPISGIVNISVFSECVCVCVCSYLTLGNPMDCYPPGSSLHGILQARILEWIAIFFSRVSFRPRDQTRIFCSLPLSHWGSPMFSKDNNMLFCCQNSTKCHHPKLSFSPGFTLTSSESIVLVKLVSSWKYNV